MSQVPPNDEVRRLDILLVEDSPTDRLMTAAALDEAGIVHTLHTIENGVDALAYLRREGRFAQALRPDLVLLDLNLPRMDGRDVLAEIKRDELLRLLPVVVLTTSEADEDVMRAYAAHADGYLVKPLALDALADALRGVCAYWFDVVVLPRAEAVERRRVAASTLRTDGEAPTSRALRVLLVEDSDSDALLLREALASTESSASWVITHERRLTGARRRLSEAHFDVALVDLGLPDSRGLDTYRSVQASAPHLPVIVLTGLDDDRVGEGAVAEGAEDYLVKGERTGRSLARAIRYAVDRRSMREQLLHARRMESIGQLAGGVAHDFNNLLTIVRASAALLEEGVELEELPEVLREIVGATERGAALTRQLVAFSRRQRIELSPIDLGVLVQGMARMLRRTLLPVTVEVEVAADAPRVAADPSMIEQVLLNLALNARDAMPQGGQLTLATRQVDLDVAQAARLCAEASAGAFVCVSVRDTGTGIDPSILPRVWDPFFTTRSARGGSGLGLSTVYGIVRQHRGFGLVQSTPGLGSTFEIYLPASTQEVQPTSSKPPRVPAGQAGHHVLFVDDEAAICSTACRILRRHGHTAVPATSGEEALARWDAEGPFDVVIADMSMPEGMTGQDLAVALRKRAPRVPIVICSGHAPDVLANHRFDAGISFLRKPFRLEELLAAVDEATASPG